MDINRLLSPDAGSARDATPASAQSSPRKPRRPATGGKRTSSGLSQEFTLPQDDATSHPPSRLNSGFSIPQIPSQQAYSPGRASAGAPPNFRPLHAVANTSAPVAVEAQSSYGYFQAEPQRPKLAVRQSPQDSRRVNPQAETLAGESSRAGEAQTPQTDVAPADPASRLPDIQQNSRQPYARSESSSTAHNSVRSLESQRSPSLSNQSGNAPPRAISSQSLADLTMAEAPAQTPPPRTFTSNALTETEAQTVNELLEHLGENSYAYDSHVQLIHLLHKGLLAHVYPPEGSDEIPQDPHSYNLLAELRQAREAMDSRFAVGEDLWVDWLSDEMLLAKASEERIAVMELFQKAVQDEPASVILWEAYANWVDSNYAACNDLPGSDQTSWNDDDKEVCRELFTRDMLVDVLKQAIAATEWRIDTGYLLWNRYITLVQQDIGESPDQADLEQLQNLFFERLKLPSAGWEETAQMFWPLISKIHRSNWEAAMSRMNELAEPAKTQMNIRDESELKLQRAIHSGDKNEIFNEFSRCMKWEKKPKKRGSHFEKELRSALYERALLRFPTYTEWWLDYVDYVISQRPSSHDPSNSVLPLIERATRHCPWSGELWARRILRSDVERKSYHEIEAIKHRATNSGLLDVGGMEEMLKVLMEWCSYLRRNAFTSTSSEDDLDTAEVGITMAIEDVQQAGRKLYGEDFQGDPLFRLERIQMKFLAEARRIDETFSIYRSLVPKQKDSFDFWARWYQWELIFWGHDRLSDSHRVETTETGPHRATAVMDEMLSQRNLDQPEKAVVLYMDHFQHHESVEKLQEAGIKAREFSQRIALRRAKEAETAAAVMAQKQQVAETQVADAGQAVNGEKRKREAESAPNGESSKRMKAEESDQPNDFGEASASTSGQIKRDRENSTITLTNLSIDIQDADLKKFFRDCGTIVSISIIPNPEEGTAIATLEFETVEDVATAKTRDGKPLNGKEVHIQSGSRSTLFVTNYPAEYDEAGVRKLFDAYGDIISVRFPSLKFNARRKFCYVQFLSGEQAKAAQDAMDGKMLDGQHRLMAKISDPEARKNRSGARDEGRELFVKNLDFTVPESEVKDFFAQNGNVISINMLKRTDGRQLGTCFIVFSNKDEADAAVEHTNNKPFHDRVLHVSIATAHGGAAPADKALKTDIHIKQSASPEPSTLAGRRGLDVSMSSAPHDEDAAKTVRERKIAIFNLPDTVHDARVRAEMEKHGAINSIQLRRNQNAAIVEFADVKIAFNVRSGVDCSALGAKVRTGDVSELFMRGKKKGDITTDAAKPALGFGGMRPSTVARPGQQRGGRRGGLGFKRGVGFASSGSSEPKAATSNGGGAAKSNAEFKAMFEKSRESKPEGQE